MHPRPVNGVRRGTGAAGLAVSLLPVFCYWLLSLFDGFRQTDTAMPAESVAAAVLPLVSHGDRLAVVAICLMEGQRD